MKKILALLALALTTSASFAQVDVSAQVGDILSNTKNLLIKVADSRIDLNNLSLDDGSLVNAGVLTQDELNEFNHQNQSNGTQVKELLGITADDEKDCLSCKTPSDQKIEKLKAVIASIRKDKADFVSKFDIFTEAVRSGSTQVLRAPREGPNCSWGFYICVGVASTITEGLGAAAAVWLCACEYCAVRPPVC